MWGPPLAARALTGGCPMTGLHETVALVSRPGGLWIGAPALLMTRSAWPMLAERACAHLSFARAADSGMCVGSPPDTAFRAMAAGPPDDWWLRT